MLQQHLCTPRLQAFKVRGTSLTAPATEDAGGSHFGKVVIRV